MDLHDFKPGDSLRVVDLDGLRLGGGKPLPWKVGDTVKCTGVSKSGHAVQVSGCDGYIRPHRFERSAVS